MLLLAVSVLLAANPSNVLLASNLGNLLLASNNVLLFRLLLILKTLVFNFDNRARLYKPSRLSHSTITINNTEEEMTSGAISLFSCK